MNSEQLIDHLKLLRSKSGLSLREAARQADIGATTISDWESGRSTPSPATMKRYASSFGLSELEVDRLVARRSPTGGTGTTLAHAGVVLTGLRDQAGMTLRELAAVGQVDASTLLRWERGECTPTPEAWARVVAAIPPERSDGQLLGHVTSFDTESLANPSIGDPDGELPAILDMPDHLFEHRLRGYEILATRRAPPDSRWWDWLARLQSEAIGGFLARGHTDPDITGLARRFEDIRAPIGTLAFVPH